MTLRIWAAALLIPCGACGAVKAGVGGADEALDVSGCFDVSSPGAYTLDDDVTAASLACVHVHDTSDVVLDCGGHAIHVTAFNAFDIERVTNLTLAHCTTTHSDATAWSVELDHVTGGSLHDNDLDGVDVRSSSGLGVANNHIRVVWQQYSTTGTIAQANTFDNPAVANTAALFLSVGGAGNQLLGNRFDGFWSGNPQDYDVRGTDDGIDLSDEQWDVVDSNTITNSWDCGIETSGTITDSRFTNNQISNSMSAAIGSFYNTSWLRNVVQGNRATATGDLFDFFRADLGLRAGDTAVSFRDNTFSGNAGELPSYFQFVMTRTGAPFGSDVRNINAGDYRVGNNVFTGNAMGSGIVSAFPWFVLVDGGGNSCGTLGDPTQALACSRPAPGPAVFSDVPPSDPDFFLIDDMSARGITHGCTPTEFCVSDLVTRDQVAVFIIRALYGDSFSYTPTPYFTDVPAGDVYFPYVQKMMDLGITQGCTPTSYCRGNPVSAGELAVFLVRANQIRGHASPAVPDTAYFADVPPNHGFYPYVQVIREQAIMPGCSVDSFCPDLASTREAVASALMRMLLTN